MEMPRTSLSEHKNLSSFTKAAEPTANNHKKLSKSSPDGTQKGVTNHWMKHYQELQKFKSQFGHCNASRKNPVCGVNSNLFLTAFVQEFKSLGHWVHQQRRKNKQNKLTDRQKDLLKRVGFGMAHTYLLI